MNCWFAILLCIAAPVFAHVNSPDVYFEGDAGPYHLFVTVRVPEVIPGIARIEIRSASAQIRSIRITALRITGPGADLAPTPDAARRSKEDPQFFTGNLWLMLRGSWQVRVQAEGLQGKGELAVPVPAVAKHPLPMQKSLGAILFVLMVLLAVGVVGMIGAAAREAKLEPAEIPGPQQIRRGRIAMAISTLVIVLVLLLGNQWWNAEAAFNASFAYKMPRVAALVKPNSRLVLKLQNPNEGWGEPVRLDDLIPDHEHLMHLFLIRIPEMDEFRHLHPEKVDVGVFEQQLSSMPAGRYQIYADVVHRTGFAETYVGEVAIPEIEGKPPGGDDCEASGLPLSQASYDGAVASLSDGATMTWLRDPSPLAARRATQFRFLVKDKDGNPARDLELYMGMPGHAQFVRSDRSVFAHVHPSGTVSMAAYMLAQASLESTASNPHSQHTMESALTTLPPEVSFLYGFPEPGDYRMFVQIKRNSLVQTAIFDMHVLEHGDTEIGHGGVYDK